MARKIKILDESISNIIAAGEVVENPASLVKELVENSLDANADMIKIQIKKSGRYVRVVDNGTGMSKEDAFLSIERHATSKIYKKEDIFQLLSYGFRGEALASIAAVAKLKIKTKTSNDRVGTLICVNTGNISKVDEVAMNDGTEIEVKDLFFNTPARLKFLRTKNTEYSKIKDIVLKEALVNYNVSFSLEFDGKEILRTSGKGIENTILELFGKNILKNLMKFEHGYIGNPSLTRSSRDYIFTYFNKRYAKAKIAEKAVIDAYYTKLEKNRYPFAIVFFEVDPAKIDVNVHPSKKIVKFSNEMNIYKDIYDSILESFGENERKNMPELDFEKKENTSQTNAQELKPLMEKNEISPAKDVKLFTDTNYLVKDTNYKRDIESSDEIGIYKVKEENDTSYNNTASKSFFEKKEEKQQINPIEEYKILGQLNNMYIMVETKDSLEIYDQHIVHERILYEELKEKFYSTKVYKQNLLVPLVLNLDYRQKDLLMQNIDLFEKFGFKIEEFGESEIIIRTVPLFDFRSGIKDIFDYVLGQLISERKVNDIRESIIISMSCKGAIKAGEKLNFDEMEKLIKRLHEIGNYTCPHGRPIIVNVAFDSIDKMFKRK